MKCLSALACLLLAATHASAQRGQGPEVGKEAPNFKAKVVGRKKTVELKAIVREEKRPVVLIFGSYT